MPQLTVDRIEQLLDERFEQAKARSHADLFAGVLPETQLWLASLPAVTASLASATGLPVGELGLSGTLDRMVSAGLVEVSASRSSREPRAEPVYRMTEAARELVLDSYLTGGQAGELRKRIEQIAHIFRERAQALLESGSPLQRWVLLASHADDSDALVEAFDREVAACERRRDPVELKRWIDTGRPLAALLSHDLDTSLDIALNRAARRLELLARRQQDDIHLNPWFLERPEQVDAIRRLLTGPDDLWALHLWGEGGVGKTMLLRYLTSRLAPAPGDFQAATARIDFDYLNADYPRLDPGLLLWAFAQELRLFDRDGRATELFDKADRLLKEVQQRRRDPSLAAQRATADPRFANALVPYIDALRSLGQRVVLVVDTCEELTKIRPDGTIPENVAETFAILEALHDGPGALTQQRAQTGMGMPTLRVIFAGRRPLANAGHGWRCPTSRLQPRPYLRLHELRGFTLQEAERFLSERAGVAAPLVEPIVRRCLEAPDDTSVIEWDEGADAPRYALRANPYDLWLLADWATGDPPPSAETIARSSSAQYVELRILKRLEQLPDLERALPVIALVKHVDRELLTVILGEGADSELVFDRLCEQEWAARRQVSGPDGKPRDVAVIDEGLRRRLWRYYEDLNRFDALVVERVGDHLAALTLERDLSELDWPLFDATLRALERRPVKAAEWWDKAEGRIISSRGFGWLLDLTGFLVAERNAAAPPETLATPETPPESLLRPRILASYAAAMLHTGGGAQRESTWQEVLDGSARHPTPDGASRLRARAICGIVAARLSAGDWPADQQTLEVWHVARDADPPLFDEDLAASILAAAEAIVEHNEGAVDLVPPAPVLPLDFDGALGPVRLAERLQGAFGPTGGEDSGPASDLVRFAGTLAGRALVASGRLDEAAAWFTGAAQGASATGTCAWPDWLAPDDLDSRVRVEAIRALYPSVLSVDQAIALAIPPDSNPNIDRDRLLSLMVRLHAAKGPLDPAIPYRWANGTGDPVRPSWALGPSANDSQSPAWRSRCCAHIAVPSFFVAAAASLAACGYVDNALAALHREAARPRHEPTDLRHLERAMARVQFRMRLRDEGDQGGKSLEESPIAADRGLLWALNGLDGLKNQEPIAEPPAWVQSNVERDVWWHAIWRGCFALDAERAGACVAWLARTLEDMPPVESPDHIRGVPPLATPERMARVLDLHEGAAVEARTGSKSLARFGFSVLWRLWPETEQSEASVVLAARMGALGRDLVSPEWSRQGIAELRARIGFRRTADLLFEEGDLLALRAPEPALILLREARDLYGACGDHPARLLTLARITELDPLATQLAELRTSYEAMSASVKAVSLPAWDTLVAIADQPTPEALEALAPRGWRPWLVRLVGLLAVARGRAAGLDKYFEWVGSHYGARAGETVLLPAEIHAVASRAEAGAGGAATLRRTTPLANALKRAGSILAVAVGAVVGVAFVVLLFRGYQWAVTRILPSSLHTTLFEIGSFVALLAFLGSLGDLSKVLKSAYASLWRLNLTVDFSERGFGYRSESVQTATTLMLEVLKPRLGWAGLSYVSRAPTLSTTDTPGAIPYTEASALIPPDVVAALRQTVARAGKRSMELTIAPLASELHGPCWEAMVHYAVTDSIVMSNLHLRYRRASSVVRIERVRRAGNVAVLARTTFGRDFAREGWSGRARRRSVFIGDEEDGRWLGQTPPRENPFTSATQPITTLHVIGTVERTPGGLRLRPSTGPIRERAQAAELETSSALARKFPRLSLCIMQGAPLSSGGPRLDDDRLTASLSRSFAAEIAASCDAAVIVIPPLLAPVAKTALESVIALIRRSPRRGTFALERCVDQMRDIIVRGIDDPNAAWESAMDVCLFCDADWDGRSA
jgi:hypothetical protein